MMIKTRIEKIKRSDGNFKYLLIPKETDDLFTYVFLYTDDSSFTEFSYPIYVYMSALFEGTKIETDWFTELTTYKYYFSNVEAVAWE